MIMKVENNSLLSMGGLQVYRSLFLVMCLQINYVAAVAETDEPFEIVSCILYFNSTESFTPRHWHNIEIFLNVVNFPWSNDRIQLASSLSQTPLELSPIWIIRVLPP